MPAEIFLIAFICDFQRLIEFPSVFCTPNRVSKYFCSFSNSFELLISAENSLIPSVLMNAMRTIDFFCGVLPLSLLPTTVSS